jgi:hypothetical protein
MAGWRLEYSIMSVQSAISAFGPNSSLQAFPSLSCSLNLSEVVMNPDREIGRASEAPATSKVSINTDTISFFMGFPR